MPSRRTVTSSRCASPSCGSSSTPSTRRLFENETSIHALRSSSWTGAGISRPTRDSHSLFIWSGRPGPSDEAVILREAIHEFFRERAARTIRRLRDLFRRGRISLAIGLTCLASSIGSGDALALYFLHSRWTEIVTESLLIGGWVAMWRPLEIFLYDWWPIRAEARLCDRLSAMPVRIVYGADTSSDAWREDWPAVPAVGQSSIARPASGALASGAIPPEHGRQTC